MNFQELNRISSGYSLSRILQVAVRVGIFDKIHSNGSTSQDITETIKTNHRATGLFLNALVALGFLIKKEGKFFNTEIAKKYLLKESSEYFGGMILFEHLLWNIWEGLEESIKSGKPRRINDMFQANKEQTELFIGAMHSLVRGRGDARLISEILNLNWATSMIDIGSGPGTYPIEFLNKYPHLKITIFDLPATLKVTKRIIEEEGMSGKIDLLEGDYNTDKIPEGFDIAFLSNIIHSEDEETNMVLMKNIFGALNKGGKLIIKDHILDDNLTSPAFAAIFSITMLLLTKGRDYSVKEVSTWLQDAGFKTIEWKKLPESLNSSLIIARKAT